MDRQFNRVYVTGDFHGQISDLAERVECIPNSSKDDLLIVLGDCAFFYSVYYNDLGKDFARQKYAAKLPITLLCIQGNHEVPYKEMLAKKNKLLGGDGFESNGIYFADNGTVLKINGKKCLVVGGAYSVDKDWRLMRGSAWWNNEELSDDELNSIYEKVKNSHYDFVLTHTCPYDKLPREVFLEGVDQSKIENRTEKALQRIKYAITFDHWYCGKFHTYKTDGKLEFFYYGYKQIL
jgi:3-oxoacid CoA-transferase subunit A